MALRASDVEELPPIDLTGLPTTNAYGEPVDLPKPPTPAQQPAAVPQTPAPAMRQPMMTGGDFAQNRARVQAQRESVNIPGARSRAGDAAVEARQQAEEAGASPAEARQAATDAFRQMRGRVQSGEFRGQTSLPQAPTQTPAQPTMDANVPGVPDKSTWRAGQAPQPTAAMGAMGGGPQMVGNRQGPMMQGAGGAIMPFVEDPITGYALPTSDGMSLQEYSRALDEGTRANILEVLSSGTDKVSRDFQRIDQIMEATIADLALSPRQREEAKARLRRQQDEMMWSAMGNPSARMAGRRRQQAEQQAEQERENRQSLAVQERLERQRQQQSAKVYADAYKRAQTELQTDPYARVDESKVRARAQELFNQQMAASGMARPAPAQAGGGLAPSQPPSGAPTAGAAPTPRAPQSGAPDSNMMRDIAIDPGSPIDFQQASNGSLVALIPNPDDPANPVPMRAFNLNGRAVAVPSSPAELDMLPPGSLYILEGAYSRGEMREPKRKEGEVAGLTGAAAETPEAQDFAIQQEAQKRGEPRLKATKEYEEQQAEYNNMLQEAQARAAKELNVPLGAGGQYAWQSLGRTGTGERAAGIDAKGQWEDAVNKQMVAVAAERYPAGGKQAPEWVGKRGDEIIMVNKPKPPAFGEDAAAQEMAQARQDYFTKRGTTEFKVRNERLLNEARTGYTVSLRGGRPSVRVGAREYPGVRVSEGGSQAVLPMVQSRGADPKQVATSALALLTSGKPFAIDIGGRAVPFKFDRNDPRIKTMMEEPNKRIGLGSNTAGQNAGVKAATSYIDDVFGYLPLAARQEMLVRMLTSPNLGGFTLAAD